MEKAKGRARYALSNTVPMSKMNKGEKAIGQGGKMGNKPSEKADWRMNDNHGTPKKA
jgi:hypothetical protein